MFEIYSQEPITWGRNLKELSVTGGSNKERSCAMRFSLIVKNNAKMITKIFLL